MISSRKLLNRALYFLVGLAFWMGWSGAPLQAQLDREMRGMFLEIKDQLDLDLKAKFEQALQRNSDKIKFSRSEFERFRDHPANPFDGLFELEEEVYRNGIELKFELPNLRNRMVGRHERQSSRLLGGLDSLGEGWKNSIVEVVIDQQVVALATAVEPVGLLLTKASELSGRQEVVVRTSHGKSTTARLVRIDEANDLAVLKADGLDLVPVQFSSQAVDEGAFLVTLGADGQALALGSLSHAPRALLAEQHAVLGIQPRNTDGGCELVEVTRGGAGDRAGLRVGDVVVAIDSRKVVDVTDLVNEIRRRRPGTSVSLEVLRRGQKQVVAATLAARNVSPDNAARFKMMNRLGAIPSSRAEDFPWVLQHDTPLFPEQCGGPVLDIDGRVVGLNIARQGRIASLAIPSDYLAELLPDLTRDEVARK